MRKGIIKRRSDKSCNFLNLLRKEKTNLTKIFIKKQTLGTYLHTF